MKSGKSVSNHIIMTSQGSSSYDDAINRMRDAEFPMLKGSVYLDHAGSTFCPKSALEAFAHEMTTIPYGNPHSGTGPSQVSASRIEDIRSRLLTFFNADPSEYDLVFVSNTTAGVKLVVEGMRSLPEKWNYAYHQACHTSLVGVRGEASQSKILDESSFSSMLQGALPFDRAEASTTLISYTAQSHLDGQRYPLSWSRKLKAALRTPSSAIYTLLDAASLCATSPLDLSDPDYAADFTVLSLHKIFGFPDLGALIVRRSGESIFDGRKYFGGGTVDLVTCGENAWHAPKSGSLHERLEDGTLPFHNILALDASMRVHARLFGSMADVRSHVKRLTSELLHSLAALHHGNGEPVCMMYTQLTPSDLGIGPIISFNLKNSEGKWVRQTEFDKIAFVKNIHVRTGGVCSPGGIAAALKLKPFEMEQNFSAGYRCGMENEVVSDKPTGVVRVSLGAMSTKSDVEAFISFIREFFVETEMPAPLLLPDTPTHSRMQTDVPSLKVASLTIFPIKSCGGYPVPANKKWELRPEGLAWDREWCLVHQGSGRALSQKQHSRMALLKTWLDPERGCLDVTYQNPSSVHFGRRITIPLSRDSPHLLEDGSRIVNSRVCGDSVPLQVYDSLEINKFFTETLEVPCLLARFPLGSLGTRHRPSRVMPSPTKNSVHLTSDNLSPTNGVPSPPDSDSEQQPDIKILLSNESPILMVHRASIDALSESSGRSHFKHSAFRANIVLEGLGSHVEWPAYAEDSWSSFVIGSESFRILGPCQRCQMVCVDQDTGEKSREPLVTLAKTRRFGGKIYFGSHLVHEPRSGTTAGRLPTIQVGDGVLVNVNAPVDSSSVSNLP